MFIAIEVSFFLFINLIFFISMFLVNFTQPNEKGRYIFTFFLFSFLVANIFMYIPSSPVLYELLDIFQGDSNAYFIKATLMAFQFLFFLFLFLAYKPYLKPEIMYFFNLSMSSALFMVSTNDFIITFILLELSSMPIYALIALPKNRYAIEAAIKYLIYGSFASLLFIISFIFFANVLFTNNPSDMAFYNLFGAKDKAFEHFFSIFFFLSIFMKFGVGPFYNWLIDVYQASSYPLFVFNSSISKLITFVPLATIGQFFANNSYYKFFFVALLIYSSFHAVVNMFFQSNIRRFFGYSSVINFSFLIIVNFFSVTGHIIFFKYLLFYSLILFITYSVFEIYRLASSEKKEPETLQDLIKFPISSQQFAFASTILVSSGLPPIGLFYAKAYVYGEILSYGLLSNYIIVSILILNSILSLFAYFRAAAKTFNFSGYRSFSPDHFNQDTRNIIYFSLILLSLVIYISIEWTTFIVI